MMIENAKAPSSPQNALPDRCCGRCVHGRAETDQGTLKKVIVCKAHAPIPVIVPVQGPRGSIQAMQQNRYPVLAPEEIGCDLDFELKKDA